MPKAVVDTSVLVSGFLTEGGATARVIELAQQGRFTCCLSAYILDEIHRSLTQPRLMASYGHTLAAVDRFCQALLAASVFIAEPPAIGPVSRDPNDDQVLACAIAAEADYLVTGDKDLLVLEQYKDVTILTVRQFLDMFK